WQARQQLTDQCLKGTAAFYPLEDTQPAYDNGVSYPTMIYDGPFSDARQQGAAAALGEREITREEAHQAAREFVGAERVIGVSQGADMGGAIPCYGVTVQLSDITLECAVTKRGGKVLWMAPDTADFAQRLSLEECRENALSFLESRGYGPMESTHFQVYQGMVVVAFAPLQGNTLLYPDQVKVQLRGDTGQVVGIEARSYWENHGHRGVFSPRLTQEEAQGAVSSRMQVKSCRLCLIPKHQQEILCYEFRGEYKGEDYLVYIHADTGEQEELLKVVESETGLEAV
ncbi:MAG: hypothetical protein E7324_10420, partial [Clostridiales bacterium]|nr:hypothetical protein [Clostridiales bacterium]